MDITLLGYHLSALPAEAVNEALVISKAMRDAPSLREAQKQHLLSLASSPETKGIMADLLKGKSILETLVSTTETLHQDVNVGDIVLVSSDEGQYPVEILSKDGEDYRVSWLVRVDETPADTRVTFGTGDVLASSEKYILSSSLDGDVISLEMMARHLTVNPDPDNYELILDRRVIHGFGIIASHPAEYTYDDLESLAEHLTGYSGGIRSIMMKLPMGLHNRAMGLCDQLLGGMTRNPLLANILERLPIFYENHDDAETGVCLWCNLPRTLTFNCTAFGVSMGSYCHLKYTHYRRIQLLIREMQTDLHHGKTMHGIERILEEASECNATTYDHFKKKRRRLIRADSNSDCEF